MAESGDGRHGRHGRGETANDDAQAENCLQYFHDDFPLEEWISEASIKFVLPSIQHESPSRTSSSNCADSTTELKKNSLPTSNTSSAPSATLSEEDKSECNHWGKFYTSHASARVYQPRRYIYTEFLEYFQRGTSSGNKKSSADDVDNPSSSSSATTDVSLTSTDFCIFEVGCAHGCTVFPLLEKFHPSTKFIATDFCPQALEIFKRNSLFDEARISLYELDLCCSDAELSPSFSSRSDFLLATFVLSAINPIHHINCFRNMNRICKVGSYLLFRDYAFHDLTMYRHKKRYGERLFRRADNTYAFYFTKEDVEQFASTCGFIVEDLYYATVLSKNRKSNTSMNRVFLHAVLKKIADL